jgi:hypothetical protein
LRDAAYEINDPGSGVAINYSRWGMVVPFTIAASTAETNTLAAPLNANQRIVMFAQSVGSSGSRVVTVASAINKDGDLTLTFDSVDEWCVLTSVPVGSGVFEWRYEAGEGVTGGVPDLQLDSLTVAGDLTLGSSVFDSGSLATGAGAGITGGTGTIAKTWVQRSGDVYITSILLDVTGLGSSTTDLDIIGQGASAAYIAKLTAAECGTTITGLRMTCLEAPATGADDIDLYSATEGTGVFDAGIGTLAETALITAGGAWTNGAVKGCTTVPLSTEYLYLTCGEAAVVGTYTAGKFLIEIFGHA